jgi:hypothetical protein
MSPLALVDWRDQEVVNGTVFRDMNEWTSEQRVPNGDNSALERYVCECGDRTCTDVIELSRREYESVRSVAVRFALAVNHENPEIDHVVGENGRFATVEKFFGAGARIARETDPRR